MKKEYEQNKESWDAIRFTKPPEDACIDMELKHLEPQSIKPLAISTNDEQKIHNTQTEGNESHQNIGK